MAAPPSPPPPSLNPRDTAKAWAHLATANRLQASPDAYSPEREEGLLGVLASTFQAPIPGSDDSAQAFWARLLRGDAGLAGPAGAAPIFVVGLPRSGSTLVEQILASHSRVWGAGEDTELAPLVPSMVRILQGGREVSGKVRLAGVAGSWVLGVGTAVLQLVPQPLARQPASFEQLLPGVCGCSVTQGLSSSL